jgi:hypothetical protein
VALAETTPRWEAVMNKTAVLAGAGEFHGVDTATLRGLRHPGSGKIPIVLSDNFLACGRVLLFDCAPPSKADEFCVFDLLGSFL